MIGDLLLEIEQSLPEEHGGSQGSTATVGMVVAGRLEVAHVGDSRMILGKVGEHADACGHRKVAAVAVTDDHNPHTNVHERARIVSTSGEGALQGGYVGGMLQVSRSLGDFHAKELLIIQHSQEVILSTVGHTLVLGGGGGGSV